MVTLVSQIALGAILKSMVMARLIRKYSSPSQMRRLRVHGFSLLKILFGKTQQKLKQ
jgi:hypothetical protein